VIRAAPVIDEPHQLLVGPGHPLAGASAVTPAQLAGHRIWMPGMAPGTEWVAYYQELAAAFGLTIDLEGPVFGNEALLAEIAASGSLATLVGEGSRYLWPDSYDLRRIPVRDPSPVYPMSMIWRDGNPHPALRGLLDYLGTRRPAPRARDVWVPRWAR
jgi:DNA-binding transcriptional LysR family regulator